MPYFFCAICATTMLVLSPSVQATNATASWIPARRRVSQSSARPTTNSPGKSSPSRWKASGLSSMMATSKPCVTRSRARPEPTRPQPAITTCMCHLSLGRGWALAPAFGGGRLGPGGLRSAVEDRRALRRITLGDDVQQHLAGCVVYDVVRGPSEGAVGDAALAHRPQDDHLGAAALRLLHDRPAGRARRDDVRCELHLELPGDECGGGQHPVGPGAFVHESGVERQVERHLDDIETVDRRLLLGPELAGEHHHLVGDP